MDATIGQSRAIPEARAGFWRRFAGAFVDGLVLAVVNVILSVFLSRGAAYGIDLLVGAGYFTYFHGRTGQTPGNAALGIRVVDLDEGITVPIGYGRAFIRWIVSYVSLIVIALGYLWMLWDSEKQTWHDKAAGSVVIPVR